MSHLSGLPMSIMILVETLDEFCGHGTGQRIALKLMQNFGGRDVKLPKNPDETHPLVEALGMDDARILCQHLGGNQIYVPHGRPARSQRAAVQALEREGRSRPQIAAALGITERHARRVSNSPTPRPLPLFPDED
ncbi:hypothetical protein [Gemmobacter sp.]|uniref:hypothetical protein n=1 Tax=Gemmobacter sp. TaxID=1898957 RepID=UPI002AFE95A2|nr:hypothetical protein [Gemmobacter sp.]